MKAVVDHLEHHLQTSIRKEQFRPLGLATGRTMEPLYAALVHRLRSWPTDRLQLLRQLWLSFNLDEYVGLSAQDPCSFAAFMEQHLQMPLGLDACQVCLPDGAAADPAKAARDYSALLDAAGGVGLQILGLGGNGHVGFNEPPCGPVVSTRVVRLSTPTRKQNAFSFGGDYLQVPHEAITLGLREILAAEQIHLIVTGSAKKNILRRMLEQGSDPSLPASWLRRHPRFIIWADDSALGS